MDWLPTLRLYWASMLNGNVNDDKQEQIEKRLEELKKKYEVIFRPGIGKIEGRKARIKLKPEYVRIFRKPMRIAYASEDKIS